MKKNKILFKKAVTRKWVSQKLREMTLTTFVKNAVTPKLFGIFEFCKKHCIRNFSWRLAVKFYYMRLKSDFRKKIFSFFSKLGVISRSRSFLGTWGHFWFLFIHAYNNIKVLQVWWHLRYFGRYWVKKIS